MTQPPIPFAQAWVAAYRELARRIPALGAQARPLLTGFAACVDKRIDLHRVISQLAAVSDPKGIRLFKELMGRAGSGRGGEILVDWPQGPAFFDAFAGREAMVVGGTSAQAATTLVRVGATVVMALADRSADQLAVLDPGIRLVAKTGALVAANEISPQGVGKPAHYIFEYTAGQPLLGVTPPRSTRIIVRFADEDMERDSHFRAYGRMKGAIAGAALMSSPNTVPPDCMAATLEELATAATEWRTAGISPIHLELGDFPWPGARDATLARLSGTVTSLGLNRNELNALIPGIAAPDQQAKILAARLGVSRLVVHADDWALAVTRSDPWRELDALATGCLLASTRAEVGTPVCPIAAPAGATFTAPPAPLWADAGEGWSIVCCPAPFLSHPASTVGLGDSFTAGTLLVHSQPAYHPPLIRYPGLDRPVDDPSAPADTGTVEAVGRSGYGDIHGHR